MKIIKAILTFALLTALFGACFTPPSIGIKPQIVGFEDISFYTKQGNPDSLVVTINFKDGDGDLGLDPNDPYYSSDPFNEFTYFVEKGGGKLAPVETTSYGGYSILKVTPDLKCPTCKLVTNRTRLKPGYENVTDYDSTNAKCLKYQFQEIYVAESDKSVFDKTYNVKDSILVDGTKIYVLLDTIFFKPNPYHYNYDVDFLYYAPNDPQADEKGYVVFDWRLVHGTCSPNFYGRFPVLSDKKTPLEGSLQYTILSSGIKALLSTRTLKLRVTIRDRALHISNTVTSNDFTLESVKKG